MKANEFVKLRGISYCKELLIKADGCAAIQAREDNSRVGVDDLKRLVESHELVESCGGLGKAKKKLSTEQSEPYYNYSQRLVDSLKKAILDVESCQ